MMVKLFDHIDQVSNEDIVEDVLYTPNEDLVEELLTLQYGIESDLRIIEESTEAMESLYRVIDMENSVSTEAYSDEYRMVAVENFNNIRLKLGLGIEDITVSSSVVTNAKTLIRDIVRAVKKLFLNLIASIKKYITKIIHNAYRLESRIKDLNKKIGIIEKDNAINNVSDVLLEDNEAFTIFKFFRVYSEFLNYNSVSSKENFLNLISEIIRSVGVFKNTRDFNELISVSIFDLARDSGIDTIKDIEDKKEALFNEFNKKMDINGSFNNQLLTLFLNTFNSNSINSKYIIKNGIVNLHFESNIGGFVNNTDGIAPYKTTIPSKKDFTVQNREVFSIAEIKNIIREIGKPKEVINEINKYANIDIESAEALFKSAEDLEVKDKESIAKINKLLIIASKLTPSNANANIINYFSNIKNILDTLDIQLEKGYLNIDKKVEEPEVTEE